MNTETPTTTTPSANGLNEVHPNNPAGFAAASFRHPQFDARDDALLVKREAAWNARDPNRPRVGDFVKLPNGELHRFSHDWGDSLQHSKIGSGSFFLMQNGFADFSGGLEPAIPLDRIKLTSETQPGWFWFFHHDFTTAHNGVHVRMLCRVYEVTE
jgi:hypothetical protein